MYLKIFYEISVAITSVFLKIIQKNHEYNSKEITYYFILFLLSSYRGKSFEKISNVTFCHDDHDT